MKTTTKDRRKQPKLRSTMAAIMAHPLRCQILTVLDTEVAGPKELADKLKEPLGNVSYHCRVLAEAGVIELVRTEQRRGATAHFYTAVERPVLSGEEFAALSDQEKEALVQRAFQLLAADAAASLKAGLLSNRDDLCVLRMPASVDEVGWKELAALFEGIHDQFHDIIAASAARAASGGAPNDVPVVGGLTLFERARS
jgi:DNA-binding transcriptional ArsR family regulator